MKKFVIVAAAVGCAIGAYAGTLETGTETFESDIETNVWLGNDEFLQVKDNDSGLTALGEKYAHVETDTTVLQRTLTLNDAEDATVEAGDFWVDSMVKFTATEDDNQDVGDAKIALWLKATDGSDGNPAVTNLMVRCGRINDSAEVSATTVALEGTFEPDSWHRVTIKPILSNKDYKFMTFTIYIDGKIASVAVGTEALIHTDLVDAGLLEGADLEYNKAGQLFPSTLGCNAPENGELLSSLSFKGTGDIDNVGVTTENPFPPPTPIGPQSDEAEIGEADETGVREVTPVADATEVTIKDADDSTFAFPSSVTTIKGVASDKINIKNGTYNITEALAFTGDATAGVTYALNPEAVVEDVPVTPTIAAEDADFDIVGGTMEVKGIAGLYYSLVRSGDVSTVTAGELCDSKQATETGATVKLTDPLEKYDAEFYVIKVTIENPAK